jgi:preprotein translocase subunit SecF
MKQSKVIISVIVAASVLLAAIAIGLYVRETRKEITPLESESAVKPEIQQNELTEGSQKSETDSSSLTAQQRVQVTKQTEEIKQRWANMSDAERAEFRAKMTEIFRKDRLERSSRFVASPPEGRDMFGEEFLEIKSKWEDMSEEERQEFMEKMRENANAIRQGND